MNAKELAHYIDHTMLKPEATPAQVEKLCREAVEYGFHTVCINSVYVPLAAKCLRGTPVKVCSVVGFPLGASLTAAKVAESRLALEHGAHEIDMVLQVGALKAGQLTTVCDDVTAVVQAVRAGGGSTKVIFENCLLTDAEKETACRLCLAAGAEFVKTSTGFSTGGATVADVALMSRLVKAQGVGVKAAGGIRTYRDALAMIAAGATRLGCSSSVSVMAEAAMRTAAR